MAEGSLGTNLSTLESAVSGVLALAGTPGTDETPGTGLAGAASLVSTGPDHRVGSLGDNLTEQLATLLAFQASTALAGPAGVFPQLTSHATAPPADAIQRFGGVLTTLEGAFDRGLADVKKAVDAIKAIVNGAPPSPEELFKVLLDQALAVLGVLDGPEARTLQSWAASVQSMADELGPLIDAAAGNADPPLALQVVQRALDRTLDTLGLGQIRTVVDFVARIATAGPDEQRRQAIGLAVDAARTAYQAVATARTGTLADLRAATVQAADALSTLRALLRAALGTAHRVPRTPLLQPGALSAHLRQLIDDALGVQFADAAKIDDPYKAVLDKIDAAISGIDLSSVRQDVIGAFGQLRTAIHDLDPAGLPDQLQTVLAPVHEAVGTVQEGMTTLTGDIQAFAGDAVTQLHGLLGEVGEFAPDGSFRFGFAADLHELLGSAQTLISGDPSQPDAPSLAGALHALQAELDQLFSGLQDLLRPVKDALDNAVQEASGGIATFRGYVEQLHLDQLTDTLTGEVQKVLDQLGEVDLDVVVDPIVDALGEDRDAIAGIDRSDLNDIIRAALKAALKILTDIDFAGSVRGPLRDEFGQIKQVPAGALADLQAAYEKGLDRVLALKPDALLAELLTPFTAVQTAVAGITVPGLLAPLDALHEQHLQQPATALEPTGLLRPLSDRYADLTSAVTKLDGRTVLAPLTDAVATLRAKVLAGDVAAPFDALLQAMEALQATLAALKPSSALAPVSAAFGRLTSALDAVKPSVLMAPLARLAAPLTALLNAITAEAIQALHDAFALPLQALDALGPDKLESSVRDGIDAVAAAVRSVGVRTTVTDLRGAYLDLRATVADDPQRLDNVSLVDPDAFFTELLDANDRLLTDLATIRDAVSLAPLKDAYDELQERLLGLLPPYARAVLDPDTFKRLMGLADPSRFLTELDARFTALVNRLLPIRPEDLAAELDAVQAEVLGLVQHLDLTGPVRALRDDAVKLRDTVAAIRVDVLTADVDRALADVRAVVGALDPALIAADLQPLYQGVTAAIAATKPSVLLAGLAGPLSDVQAALVAVDVPTKIVKPLDDAWKDLETGLKGLDLTKVLSPVLKRLDDLEAELERALGRVESALDDVLRAAEAVV